jgi:hypothetical protein
MIPCFRLLIQLKAEPLRRAYARCVSRRITPMSKPLPTNPLGDHHVPVPTPVDVSLFNIGLIVIVAFAIWGFIFELLPMD